MDAGLGDKTWLIAKDAPRDRNGKWLKGQSMKKHT